MSFPMPNDRLRAKFGGIGGDGAPNRIIVASAWHIDFDGIHEVAILTMAEKAPFYSVEYWTAKEDGSLVELYAATDYPNICAAANEWTEICGWD